MKRIARTLLGYSIVTGAYVLLVYCLLQPQP